MFSWRSSAANAGTGSGTGLTNAMARFFVISRRQHQHAGTAPQGDGYAEISLNERSAPSWPSAWRPFRPRHVLAPIIFNSSSAICAAASSCALDSFATFGRFVADVFISLIPLWAAHCPARLPIAIALSPRASTSPSDSASSGARPRRAIEQGPEVGRLGATSHRRITSGTIESRHG
jgi:hypothetical protein